jgi:Uri superfamily endonuclease
MTQIPLLAQLRPLIPGVAAVGEGPDAAFPAEPGAYVLLVHLADEVRFARAAIAATDLSGWLVYVGSARGPGGIAARLARHFRRDKPVHWHVDELTNRAADLAALAVPGGSECDIVARLLATGRFETALRGFGSSDCRRCAAHLLRPCLPAPARGHRLAR